MAEFTLSGSITLEDHFSQSLEQLEAGAKAGTSAVDQLGSSIDVLGEAPGIKAMVNELEQLKTQAAATQTELGRISQGLQNITGADRIKELEGRIAQLQQRAKSGVQLTVADLDEFQSLNSELTRLQGNLDAVSGKSSKARGAISLLTQGLGAFGIAFGAQQIIGGAVALTELGARAEDTEKAFRNLAAAQGVNADRLLSDMQRASSGTISQLDLMTQANRALLSLGKEGTEALPQLLEGARAASLATGESVEYMFQSLVQGIAKASPMILDNLGLVIRVEEANKAYADSIGKTVEQLSAQERSTALLRATMSQLQDYTDAIGVGAKGEAENIQSLSVAITDLKTAIGEALVEAGAAKAAGGLAAGIADSTQIRALDKEIGGLIASLRNMGREDAAVQLLNEYIKAQRDAGGDSQKLIASMSELADEFEIIATSGIAARSGISAVTEAQAALAAVAAVDTGNLPDFAAQLIAADKAAGSAAGTFVTLESAITGVVRATQAWATTPQIAGSLEGAISGVEGKLLSLAGKLDSTTLTQWRDKAVKDLETMYRNMGNMTEFGIELMKAEYLKGWDETIAGVDQRQKQLETLQERHIKRLYDSAGGLQSAIEAALNTGLEVTDLDVQLTASGQYEDKVKESARQLNAIAERGFSELKVHPDWADALKIPPEVLAGPEDQLKAWARQTSQDVQNNLRPDLINWDAFIANFQAGLEAEAAKGLTIDIAVEKLQAAGLLDQDTQELRDKIAEQLGLKAPSLTIDTLFSTNENAEQQIVIQATGGKGYMEMPVELVPRGEVRYEALQGTPTGAAAANVETTATVDNAAVASSGNAAGTAMADAFTGTAVSVDVGTIILAGWTASIQAQRSGFASIGEDVGHEVAIALREAAKSDLGGFRNDLIGILLPGILRAIARTQAAGGGSGSFD